ncbi:MAG: VanZ family protein [Candidatus Auribacterota bacterium]|jgi:TctA family transporter|nr:VanZ family protein [Candidatus Auribacterota bacterium]
MNQRTKKIITRVWSIFTYNKFTPWIPVAVWMSVIFIASSITLTEGVSPFTYADKIVHFLEFGILGFFLYFALYASNPDSSYKLRIFISTFFTGLYGLSDEIHQLFVPTREFSIYDLLADIAGALFFSYVAYICQKNIFALFANRRHNR